MYAIATQAFRLREADAEDVFQEVFTRTYQHLGGLRDDEAIRPWIAQLTRRLCIDRLRASAREEFFEEDLPGTDVDDRLSELDAALDVREAMGALSESCQEILDRFFCRDESYATIAETLDIPSGTIASRISRCLAKMRKALEGRKPAPPPSSEQT